MINNKKKAGFSSTRSEEIKEAYKTIRANLVLSLIKQGCKTIVVTSSGTAEGKTTSAVNLAIALSQINSKVLLIDADLRHSNAHQLLKTDNSFGLTDLILKEAATENIIKSTLYDNLSFISSGKKVENPSELLASNNVKELIEELEKKYDYIIIDTPPLNKFSDSLPLAQSSDGVILIVRQHNTNINALKNSLKSLEFIKANILGFIYVGNDNIK